MGLFENGLKTDLVTWDCFVAEFHKINIDIWGSFHREKAPSYSCINMVLQRKDIGIILTIHCSFLLWFSILFLVGSELGGGSRWNSFI